MLDDNSIKRHFVSGVFWGIIEKLASLLTGFLITLILARILTPADYGLVNMIYIFTVLGSVLLDGGFGQAIIQRKSVSTTDISSVFYINLILSIIIYTILYFCAPYIASFYSQPSLVDISRVVFLTIPINAFCIIQHCLLTKELKIKELTFVSILSAVISGCIGIFLAYYGYGVWALVIQSISYQLVRSMALWKFSKWRPVYKFSLTFIKSIFGFSMNLLGVFTLASIFQNIYTILIGKLYNVNEVGFYNQAFRMQSVASNAVTSSIQRVTFPTFAHFQDDLSSLKMAYKKVIIITMSIYFPIMICLIAISHNLFEVLLTEKWLPCVPLFCLLCIAESLSPIDTINSSILKALGLGKKYFVLNLINYSIITISIIITFKFGIIALLTGYAASALIRSVTSIIICGRQIKYPIIHQSKDLIPALVIAILTCGAVYIPNMLQLNSSIQLLLSIILGCITYSLLNVLTKSLLYQEVKKMINK